MKLLLENWRKYLAENKKTGTLNSDYPGYVEVYSPYSKDQKIARVGSPGDRVEILGSWSDKGMRWLEIDINGTKGWIDATELTVDQAKPIAEGEGEYFPWLKEIQATDDFDKVQAILESGRFKKLNTGGFRAVYQPVDDPDHVIKMIHEPDDYKMQMNEDDFNTSKRYPLIFPRAYAHADDFSWVVMEKATPITAMDMDDLEKVLDKSFPTEKEAILTSRREANINPADPFHILKMIMSSFRGVDEPLGQDEKVSAAQDLLAPVAGPAYQELSKAMQEFNIDKYEIGRGNIGYDNEGNFKIIDSSIFDWDFDWSKV